MNPGENVVTMSFRRRRFDYYIVSIHFADISTYNIDENAVTLREHAVHKRAQVDSLRTFLDQLARHTRAVQQEQTHKAPITAPSLQQK